MNGKQAKALAMGGLVLAAGLAASLASSAGAQGGDAFSALPASITLTGVVRDFRERSVTGGHNDFERQPTGGFAQYLQQCQDTLDDEGKPAFRSTGFKIGNQWRDSAGRNIINPKTYLSTRPGDVNGSMATTAGGSLSTDANFRQWFRDVPNVNVSRQLPLTLVRQPGTNTYTFNDRTDATYANRGGFFPINNELFGNSANDSKNFHFTFELATEFEYRRGTGQVFTFTGDDDVFVFIDNKLVIDIGGVHSAVSQSIDLDRCNWLVDGQTYSLKFYFAERHRTQSNFRIDTTMQLRSVDPPATTALYD